MLKALRRLVRIRVLQEEIGRAELVFEATRLLALEQRSGRAAGEARRSRESWFGNVLRTPQGEPPRLPDGGGEGDAGPAENDVRLSDEAAWNMAVWQRSRAEAGRASQTARVERAREDLFDRRRERLQVETLLEEAATAERAAEQRLRQRQLDEWFQSRPKKIEGKATGTAETCSEAQGERWPSL